MVKITRIFDYAIKNRFFFSGLILKLLMIFFLFSPIMNKLFIPFIDYYTSVGSNPYEYFLSFQKDSFPYPAGMLYILSAFKSLLWFLPSEITVKTALLAADLSIYFILLSWLPKYRREILSFYWLSPILIYINYMHGQLDVIPIALLFISLFYLFREKFIVSIIFLALSVSTKTSVLLVVPFFYIYLYYQFLDNKKAFFGFIPIFVVSLLLVNMGYLLNDSFIKTVLENDTQNVIFGFSVSVLNESRVYPGIMLYIALIFQAMLIRIKTRDIFILFVGFAFGLIMIFVKPAPGWYYWIIPLWVYFYVSSTYRGKLLFLFLQVSFFAYFAVIPGSDYLLVFKNILPSLADGPNLYGYLSGLGWDMQFIDNLFLTVLQTVLLLNVYYMYRRGVESFAGYKIISKPFLLGVGGNSGAGKTTVCQAVSNVFGSRNAISVKGDDVHKWERGDKIWSSYTHLDPKANDLYREYEYLKDLKYERQISRKSYDHNTGKFVSPKTSMSAKRLIVYDGLHPFYLKKVRDLFDLKIFVKPDDTLATHWKIIRDTDVRGYSVEKVLENIRGRMPDYNKYIVPQEKFADIVICSKLAEPLKNIGSKTEEPKIFLEIKCKNSIYMEYWLEFFRHLENLVICHQYLDDDWQSVQFMNPEVILAEDVMKIGGGNLNFYRLGINSPVWSGGVQGIVQLFILYYILEITYEK